MQQMLLVICWPLSWYHCCTKHWSHWSKRWSIWGHWPGFHAFFCLKHMTSSGTMLIYLTSAPMYDIITKPCGKYIRCVEWSTLACGCHGYNVTLYTKDIKRGKAFLFYTYRKPPTQREQGAAVEAPGEQLGVRCLAQGHWGHGTWSGRGFEPPTLRFPVHQSSKNDFKKGGSERRLMYRLTYKVVPYFKWNVK